MSTLPALREAFALFASMPAEAVRLVLLASLLRREAAR